MKKYLLILLSAFALCVSAQTQATLTGKVIAANDNEPMIGASVTVKGTTIGTVTDLDGNYTLSNIPNNATIVFYMVGYVRQEVRQNGRAKIDILLAEDTALLDEVVVIGYGTVKKSDLTSSISTVKGDDLKTMTNGNAMLSMQGRANGVQVTATGGPGATPRVIIRGVTTMNGSDPLYVVDGMPVGTNINFLNQDDIESMEVLKDASSAAIYGTRGSNGVILITTKRGKVGKTQFQFNSSIGFQTLKKPSLAGAAEYEKVFKARYTNDKNTPVWNGKDNFTDADGTDWWDKTVNGSAMTQNYNLSFQGGADKITYSGSLGYFRQDSQFDVGNWERITGRFNMEYKFSDMVKSGMDFAPKMESWQDTPNMFSAIMRMDPTTPVFRPVEEWTSNAFDNYARSNNNQVWNPAGSLARQNKHSNEYGAMINPYISIEPLKGLVLRSQFGINARFRMTDNFSPKFNIDNLEKNEISSISRESNHWVDWAWTNTVNYTKTINQKHNFNLMGGYTMEKFARYFIDGSRDGVPSNLEELQQINAGTLNPKVNGNNEYNNLISYLGRVMYNYDNRYYVTASMRIDGSSRFPTGNKYASFPAVSLAWRLSEEAFMKDQTVLTNLKIRGGWGRVGNQNIDNSQYLNLIGSGDYVLGTGADRQVGTAISLVGNTTLQWETVQDINLGVDMSFLNNRLSITADVYSKESKDMLMQKENLLVLGYPMWNGEMWSNIGSLSAKGWEFSVNWNDNVGGLNYSLGVNLSAVKNKAKTLVGDTPILTGGFYNDYIIRNQVGSEISRFYGYVADGIFQNQTEINSHTSNNGTPLQPNAQPGDIRFKDLNNDGVIDENDKTFIGKAFPDLMLGFNTRFAYKNFDLVGNFYGTFGNDVYNMAKGSFYSGEEGSNVFAGAYNKAWHGEGTSNYIPRLSVNDTNMNYRTVSSFFVEDGSYFRCQLLQLGYTFPKSTFKYATLRVSASAQNLFTITNYSGMDPERAAMGRVDNNEPNSVMETGIDNLAYPNPRTFLFGVNLTF